jgi:hypothetical protein
MPKALPAFACVFVCVLAVPGCYESLTDIATPDKRAFFDDLVGSYSAVDPATGRLTLEKGKEKDTYHYRQFDEKDKPVNEGTLWVVKLGEAYFYQISVDGYATTDGRPVYAVGRLAIDGKPGAKTLTGFAFKSEDALFGDALVKTAEYEHEQGTERKKSRALSMPPEKLQAYLALRAAEMTEPTLKFRQTGAPQ